MVWSGALPLKFARVVVTAFSVRVWLVVAAAVADVLSAAFAVVMIAPALAPASTSGTAAAAPKVRSFYFLVLGVFSFKVYSPEFLRLFI